MKCLECSWEAEPVYCVAYCNAHYPWANTAGLTMYRDLLYDWDESAYGLHG